MFSVKRILLLLVLCCVYVGLLSGCLHQPEVQMSIGVPTVEPELLKQSLPGTYSLVAHSLGASGKDLLARAKKQGTQLEFLADGKCVIRSMPFVVQMDDKSFNVLLFFNSDGGLWEIDHLDRLILKTAPSHENPFIGQVTLCNGEVRVMFGDSDNRKAKLLTFSKIH